jgi:hypothetical protein
VLTEDVVRYRFFAYSSLDCEFDDRESLFSLFSDYIFLLLVGERELEAHDVILVKAVSLHTQLNIRINTYLESVDAYSGLLIVLEVGETQE